MPEIPLQFPWQVAQDGYRWVESHPIGEPDQVRRPFLTHGGPIAAGGFRVRQYLPLSAFSGLFRVFADTAPGRDRIEAFADRFGPLGGDIAEQIPFYDHPNAKGVPLGTGEPLSAWSNEILMMRFVIDIWEAARNGDVDRLEHVIFWTEDGSGVQILSHPDLAKGQVPEVPARVERGWIAGTHLGDDVRGRFVPGDLVKPALHYVQSKINEKELAPGTARADKLYCSTPCRTKAYRKRQAEAVRLHGEGRSVDEIARELESDAETVRGLDRAQARLGRSAPERDRIARAGGSEGGHAYQG
jgi:hypothetical protein